MRAIALGDRLRILVTAGPTREYIDPVRYLSNESTGKMGFAIAAAAARRGHAVTLVHGPVTLAPTPGVTIRPVISAADMLGVCRAEWPRQDVLIMAAAVADYRPRRSATRKLKKGADTINLELEPTDDVLAALSKKRRAGQVLIGFALEDRAPRQNAESKLQRKGLDAIVLNPPSAIAVDRSRIEILRRDGRWTRSHLAQKSAHAVRIVTLAEELASAAKHRV
jgi:phosphopantothenoylcysteine decarboxylase/phosphopantothenate--cysteine ligase